MKRKTAIVLLGIMAVTAVCTSSVMAMTYGYDIDGKMIYIREDPGDQSTEISKSYASSGALSEEERQKLSDWHRAEMEETVAYLEKYGISYDKERDQLFYQGRTVRWLIDEQVDDTMKAIQMPEGEIDVYTVRASDYTLTGVRIASQEEYVRRTEEEAQRQAVLEAVEADSYGKEVTGTEIGSVLYTFVSDNEVIESEACEDAIQGTAQGETVVQDSSMQNAAEAAEGFALAGNSYEDQKKQQEYKQNGVVCGKNGAWIWNGKEVYLLMDEDGGFYQNGSKEAEENKIYLIVKRKEDGSIQTVRQVTVEEAMAQRIAWDHAD